MSIKLRAHALKEINSGLLVTLSDSMQRTEFYQSCLTCNHFDDKTEICGLNQKRPPAIIIANGCECYDDSGEIPF